jgi:hypothetical protein
MRVLRELVLPHGAVEVGSNPAARGVASWLNRSVAGAPATPNLADYHRFWRVPGQPQAVLAWIKAHRPSAARASGTSRGGQSGRDVFWSVMFSVPGVPGEVSEVDLGVAVTAAQRGGTAVRADGAAVWLTPRAVGERVPGGVRSVSVFIHHPYGGTFPVSSVRSSGKVSRLVAFVNSREVAQPGAWSCPMIGASTRLLELRFLPSAGSPPLAQALEDGCGGLSFWIRGRQEHALAEDANLTGLLWQLGAIPVCRARQLGASATRPVRFPAPAELVAQLYFRNVSASVCGLKGFARLSLQGAGGRPLPTRITNSSFPAAVTTLTPGTTAIVDLHWPPTGASCRGRPVGAIDARLPQVTGVLRVKIASANPPLAPCNGTLGADPIG